MKSPALAEGLAQRRHTHGQVILFHFDVGPDGRHNLALLDDASAITHEQREELKFRSGERHQFAMPRQAPRLRLQQEWAKLVV
jgi:hypothetical protein